MARLEVGHELFTLTNQCVSDRRQQWFSFPFEQLLQAVELGLHEVQGPLVDRARDRLQRALELLLPTGHYRINKLASCRQVDWLTRSLLVRFRCQVCSLSIHRLYLPCSLRHG